MENEEWRDIEGYEGYYRVSNKGRVYSLPRVITIENKNLKAKSCERVVGGCYLKVFRNKYGYGQVSFLKNKKSKSKRVHRLVACAFIKKKDKFYSEVNHKDSNRMNNLVENLEWTTNQGNMSHKQKVLVKKGYRKAFRKNGSVFFDVTLYCLGQQVRLGRFATKKEAQDCYFKTFKEFFGYGPVLEDYHKI